MSAAIGSEGGPSPASVAPATPRSQASCVPQQDSSVPAMSPQSSSDNLPTLSFEPCQKPVSSVTGQVRQTSLNLYPYVHILYHNALLLITMICSKVYDYLLF